MILSCVMKEATCSGMVIPFIPEETKLVIQDQPGCYLDGIYHAFGDRWSPVFVPQGVMVCVKCECLPIEKKGILQTKGQVMCRNIKDLCPEPECDHPVLQPGRCCKSCKTKDDFESTFTFRPKANISNNIYSFDDAAAYKPREFQALLVGRHVLSGAVRTKAVAMVHISTTKGRIQFALRYSRLDRPKYLKLADLHGNVLFEKPIQKGVKGDRKVCGSWHKVPAIYLNYFRQGKLYAVITTSKYPDGIVAGKITPKAIRSSETFSALLSPSKPDGTGGEVKIVFTPGMKLATYDVYLEGMKKSWQKEDFQITVQKHSQVIHQARGSLMPKTDKLSGTWRVSKKRHRKQLARGRLHFRVTFSDGSSVRGTIQPRLMCGVFQAVLSSSQTADERKTSSAGSAIIQIGENGRLDYSIQVIGLTHNLTRVRLEGPTSKYDRKSHVVGNLYKTSRTLDNLTPEQWTNGSYRRLEAEDMVRLLNNQLYVNIATTRHKISELRGRLVSLEYHEHFDKKASAVNLRPVSNPANGGAAHAWLSLDAGCHLHFDVTLVGTGRKSGPFNVLLRSGRDGRNVAVLQEGAGKPSDVYYNYRITKGISTSLPDYILRALNKGEAIIQIKAKRRGKAVYEGNVSLPNNCWRYSNDMSTDYMEYATDNQTGMTSLSDPEDVPLCNFEGQLYEGGSTWLPDIYAECTTCSCVSGKTLCQRMICPTLPCDKPIQREGECCPSCPNEIDAETCQLGKDPRRYRVHSVWHPYLPMEGFTKCAVCTCMPGGRVECNKLPCPVPNCPKSQWITSTTNPCCHQCGPATTTEPPIEEPQQDINMKGACDFLGQIKENNERWHPDIHPFGYMKCFFCECKNGIVNCGRVECPQLHCRQRIKRPSTCCEECAPNQGPEIRLESVYDTPKENTQKECRLNGKLYPNGKRWRPTSSPVGSGECAVCQCREGSIMCRLRCPKVCKEDPSKDPCCKHCEDRMKLTVPSEDLTETKLVRPALPPMQEQKKKSVNKPTKDDSGDIKDLIALYL